MRGCDIFPEEGRDFGVGRSVGEDASDEAGPERIGIGGEALRLTDMIALEAVGEGGR